MGSARIFLFLTLAAWIFLFCTAVNAKAPVRAGNMEDPSGLEPVFANQAQCTGIASPYGSTTRYDGSTRPVFRFGGRHGGIDLSLAEGTPLLAVANGRVVHAGEGKQMEGFYVWLQHAPEETGLSYMVYSKYQHLLSLPELAVGAKVSAGQVIAYSGKTGTTGGHYGANGYPHLHLSLLKSPKSTFKVKNSLVLAPDSTLMDPLLLYHDIEVPGEKAIDKTSSVNMVTIPYMSTDGQIVPPGASVVWPVACQ